LKETTSGVSGEDWPYPKVRECRDRDTTFLELASCKFNLTNQLEFPLEAFR
jgi:hypothetical protein